MRIEVLIILASNSPRRKWLFEKLGLNFKIQPADVDEENYTDEHPGEYVIRTANQKAHWISNLIEEPAIIIAADTTVAIGNRILGKPMNVKEAVQMLQELRGKTHQVYTGLSVIRVPELITRNDLCVTEVPIRYFSDDEMMAYIATGDPFDKAGAYAIQHHGFHPVEDLAGCFANVVGLPMCHLARTLSDFGISIKNDIPQICKVVFKYECPIYKQYLDFVNEQ
ncbi:MAG TPA: septum formation protein Maf [Anaerolineae bacterium]|nr:septum formation protein Maf [Anaerolineae bacterium]